MIDRILSKREEMPTGRSLLIGISGIDASGKGFITAQVIVMLKIENATKLSAI